MKGKMDPKVLFSINQHLDIVKDPMLEKLEGIRDSLGTHLHCRSALVAARGKGYNPVDGCAYCCPDCHKR